MSAPIDGPVAEQLVASLAEKASNLIALTKKLYAETADMSAPRRYMELVGMLTKINKSVEGNFPSTSEDMWIPILSMILLQTANPDIETLREMEL